VPVEITPLPIQLEPETVHTVSVPTTTSIAPPEVELPARRGRTRSRSAAVAVDSTAVINAVVSAQPAAVVEPELDESGEPRRRRRRSSAAS